MGAEESASANIRPTARSEQDSSPRRHEDQGTFSDHLPFAFSDLNPNNDMDTEDIVTLRQAQDSPSRSPAQTPTVRRAARGPKRKRSNNNSRTREQSIVPSNGNTSEGSTGNDVEREMIDKVGRWFRSCVVQSSTLSGARDINNAACHHAEACHKQCHTVSRNDRRPASFLYRKTRTCKARHPPRIPSEIQERHRDYCPD